MSTAIADKTIEDLGWDRLVVYLAGRTHTERGEAAARALALHDDPAAARRHIDRIAEARGLRAEDAALPFGGITDVEVAIARADKGGVLSASSLLAVARTARGLARLADHVRERGDRAPMLAVIAGRIGSLGAVSDPIADRFDADGNLADHASDALGPLRRKLQQQRDRLEQRLRRMLEDRRVADHLQDRYFTQRGDRYVVPVKASARSRVRGIVHDTSQSGQTVFVEPDDIVEHSNTLKLAELAVQEEERRILAMMSGWVAGAADELRDGLAAATDLDLIDAGARLADDLDASPPAIVTERDDDAGWFVLHQARHPLMVLGKGECVPNDIRVDPGKILIVSGPNAGGKTVALKTAGLCALMARAGLHIPVLSGSRTPWFRVVHTDIGDSQSLDQDLSTFSAHVSKLRGYLAEADEHTLVLIDEIAVGTEPEQGAALAQAVLEGLAGAGVPAIVTTHYERLKLLGARDPRFANASVGYDMEAMAPTFELHLGVPGSSGALHVARRHGLPEPVVDRAAELLGDRRASVEELIAQLSNERRQVADTRGELERELARAVVLRQQAEAARDEAVRREKELRRRAHTEAVAALRHARDELDRVRAAVKKRGKGRTEPAQRADVAAAQREVDRLASGIAAHAPELEVPAGEPATVDALSPGTAVVVPALGGRGTVVELPQRGRVMVQVGAMRTHVSVQGVLLDKAGGRASPAKPKRGRRTKSRRDASGEASRRDDRVAVRTPDATVDVRGERVDEAVASVDRFIDQSLIAMRDVVLVIHGHGTGALRTAVREHLAHHVAVASVRPGEKGEGGDGVTVAWLDVR